MWRKKRRLDLPVSLQICHPDPYASSLTMEVSKKRKQWPWIAVQGNWKRSIWASQLRQVPSQFHHPSTLYLCRATNFIAMPSDCQPFSVFTFCNYENGNKTDTHDNASIVASQLFRKIAYGILSSQDSTLPKSLVSALVSSCPPGKIHDVLRSILRCIMKTTS